MFLLKILDKRSTFSREKTETKLHWSFCDNEKEVLPRFELGSFGFKVQGANQYTLEPDDFTACVLLDFWRQAFYIF